MKALTQKFFSGKKSKNKQLGYQFHRQVPLFDYIVDFSCHELHLAVEVDGKCHESDSAKQYDAKRQSRLEKCGVRFLRFDDDRMKGKVVEEIKSWIEKIDDLKSG
jgi:very-short-patch-repair endonuclease